MTITPIAQVRRAYTEALQHTGCQEAASAAVAQLLGLPVEAVREAVQTQEEVND